MTRIISSLFDDYQSARDAIAALHEAGFTSSDVSIVASNAKLESPSRAAAVNNTVLDLARRNNHCRR